MTAAARRPMPSAPIWVRILALMIGGLVAAQVVTLALTLLLPPAPPQQHSLAEIAGALQGGSLADQGGHPLIRTLEAGPPSLQSPGWVVSAQSTDELVKLLDVPADRVRLLFYAPPPLAGTGPPAPRGMTPAAQLDTRPRLALASFWMGDQAEAPAGGAGPGPLPSGGAMPDGMVRGGLPPRGVMPGAMGGGGFPGMGAGGAARGSARPTLPFGGFPQGPPSGRRAGGAIQAPAGFGARSARDIGTAPSAAALAAAAQAQPSGVLGGPAGAPPAMMGGRGGAFLPGGGFPRDALLSRRAFGDPLEAAAFDPVRVPPPRSGSPPVPAPAPSLPTKIVPAETVVAAPTLAAPVVAIPAPLAAPVRPAETLAAAAPAPAAPAAQAPAQPERALSAPQRASVFGLARAAYVEGEFVAAVRNADGRWTTVRPQPEGFPNSWQRRVLLWFGLAFAIVAPLGYLFSRRLAAPLNDFAAAAERLGRDPSADLAPLAGPAEVGRPATAFNLMQRRLKRYLDDRTGMIGAISHDLRTPLARMRFKLERAPPALRMALDRDIRQMEEMIDSVLSFMRDEAAVAARERVDLRSLLECVVDEVEGGAELAPGSPVEVEVDLLGFQRVFENLVGNAVKYGDHARVRLLTVDGEAVVEIVDNGPGLADEDLEQVFKPFYRTAEAKASGKTGMGLGLAVSRSTIRAHGGDLTLRRGETGLIAEVRLPLPGAISLAA